MSSSMDADYLAARAVTHGQLAERTTNASARRVHRELSHSYAMKAASLAPPLPQAT